MPIILGLTGSISSGKSTVAKLIKARYTTQSAIYHIDMDTIAASLREKTHPCYTKIIQTFPDEDILTPSKDIDALKLGQVIFTNPTKRKMLNNIMHPYIARTMVYRIIEAFCMGYHYILLDAPLLIETKLNKLCSEVIVVDVDEDVQIERLCQRDGISEDVALSKISAQMSSEEKKGYATVVIDNNGDMDALVDGVERCMEKLDERKNWFRRELVALVIVIIIRLLVFYMRD